MQVFVLYADSILSKSILSSPAGLSHLLFIHARIAYLKKLLDTSAGISFGHISSIAEIELVIPFVLLIILINTYLHALNKTIKARLRIIRSKDIEFITACSAGDLPMITAFLDHPGQSLYCAVTLIMPEFIIDTLESVHIDDHGTYGLGIRYAYDRIPAPVIKAAPVQHTGEAVGNTQTL